MAEVVRLRNKTVGDDWTVFARLNTEASGEGVTPADWTDLRAQLRNRDGILLASSDPADVEEGAVEITFDGDADKGVPATDLEAAPPVLCLHIAGTGDMPSGFSVYLQVSATAESLQGRQTIVTFGWLVDPEIEVS